MTTHIDWKGSYYDGLSLVPQPVSIIIEPSGLTFLASSGQKQFWPYSEIQQTQGHYSGEEVRLEWGEGISETLVIPNANVLLDIHRIGGERVRHFHHPGTRRARVYWTLAAAIAAFPIIYGIFSWGVPSLAGPITAAIPVSWEIKLGQFIQKEFTDKENLCKNRELAESIESIMTRLLMPIQDRPYEFELTIVDSPMVNAMAAPGGYLVVFRGLLQDTESPEELAGVLAHEVQHVMLRHGMRLIVRHLSMAVIIAALSGDASGMLSYGLQAAQTLQALSYSREAENQADEQGLALLQKASINPEGMISFFEKLGHEEDAEETSPLRYFSTHPPSTERRQHLEELAFGESKEHQELLLEKEWETIKKLCGESTDLKDEMKPNK